MEVAQRSTSVAAARKCSIILVTDGSLSSAGRFTMSQKVYRLEGFEKLKTDCTTADTLWFRILL